MPTSDENPINHQIAQEIDPYSDTVQMKAIAAQYSRKFNLGDYNSLDITCIVWVRILEGEAVNVHDAMTRLRNMARENVRAQLLRHKGIDEIVFLGLPPSPTENPDPFYIKTVSVSLERRVNLGNYESICPSFTDWADLRDVSNSPAELHIALERMWASLWANIDDEIARAQGQKTAPDAFFGLPQVNVELVEDDDEDDVDFADWMAVVEIEIKKITGHRAYDFNQSYRDLYEHGLSPEEAARKTAQEAMLDHRILHSVTIPTPVTAGSNGTNGTNSTNGRSPH